MLSLILALACGAPPASPGICQYFVQGLVANERASGLPYWLHVEELTPDRSELNCGGCRYKLEVSLVGFCPGSCLPQAFSSITTAAERPCLESDLFLFADPDDPTRTLYVVEVGCGGC